MSLQILHSEFTLPIPWFQLFFSKHFHSSKHIRVYSPYIFTLHSFFQVILRPVFYPFSNKSASLLVFSWMMIFNDFHECLSPSTPFRPQKFTPEVPLESWKIEGGRISSPCWAGCRKCAAFLYYCITHTHLTALRASCKRCFLYTYNDNT